MSGAWLVRYFEPLYWVPVLVFLITGIVQFCRRKRSVNRRRRLTVLFLPSLSLAAAVWLLVVLRADAIVGKPGEVIRLDDSGQPKIGSDGKYLKVDGDPTDPGFYRVNLDDGYFLLQLPHEYGKDDERLAFACHLIGSHESEPTEMCIRGFRMTEHANKHRFVNFYPIPPAAYTLLGEPHHTWYSPLGTLSPRYGHPRDDAKFIRHAYAWMRKHILVDANRFSLHGFSDGALLAADIAQTETDLPIDCLFLAGGTILDWQRQRRLKGKGPRTVVIQFNRDDNETLPIDTDEGRVVKGSGFMYWAARNLIGLTNLDHSRPRLQVDYWLGELRAHAGSKQLFPFVDAQNDWTRTAYGFRTPDDQLFRVFIYVVEQGGHALHGPPATAIQGNRPNKDFFWPEIVSDFITDK